MNIEPISTGSTPLGPKSEVREERGPIDVKASAKEALIISDQPPSKVGEHQNEELSPDLSVLNNEIEKALTVQKGEQNKFVESIIANTPSMIKTGLGWAVEVIKQTGKIPVIRDGLDAAGALITLLTAPSNIVSTWNKWEAAKNKALDFERSPSVDYTKSKAFYDAFTALLKNPNTNKEDIEAFLAKEGISLKDLGITLDTPSQLAKFKKEVPNDKALLQNMWSQHKAFLGKNFREELIEQKSSLKSSLQALQTIGINIPHWKDRLAERVNNLNRSPAEKNEALSIINSLDDEIALIEIEKALAKYPELSLEHIITTKSDLIDTLKTNGSVIQAIDNRLAVHKSRLLGIQGMLEKRKKIEEKRAHDLEPAFKESLSKASKDLDTLLKENPPDKKEKFHQIIDDLKGLGLRDALPNLEEGLLDDSIKTLISTLDDKKSFQSLLKSHVNHHETMSASIRNGLQAMSAVKVNEEKAFYKYTLVESTVLGAFSIVSAIVTVIGFGLTLSGIFTLPGLVGLIFGAIGTALSVGSMTAGGLYAYYTSPNRFSEGLFSLRNIRTQLSSIPYGYRKYLLSMAMIRKNKNELVIQVLSAKMQGKISEENIERLKPVLKSEVYELLKQSPTDPQVKEKYELSIAHHKVKMTVIDEQLSEAFAKYMEAKQEHESHKKAMRDAGMRDFVINNPGADLLFNTSKAVYTPNVVDALGDMQKTSGVDEMTMDALKHYTGVDMKQLSENAKNDYLEAKERIEFEMKRFYGGTMDDILKKE